MYKRNSRFGRRNNNFNKYHSRGGNGRKGNYRVKAFDPSFIVNKSEEGQKEVYETKNAFSDFSLSAKIKGNIQNRGYQKPTPIQDQAIPVLLTGKDVVGIANTGTGKTAAFLLPLLNKVAKDRHERVLIIAPTRELAVQIQDEFIALSSGLGLFSVVCIGGVSINGQKNKLKRNPQFVIGTPGRLLDLNNQKKLNFREFRSVVLDEVDHMLDMGFIRDIRKIIDQLPSERQSLFFSATVGENVMQIMKEFTKEPITISVKAQDITALVDQSTIKINGRDKMGVLEEMLDAKEFEKVLVFGRTKRGAEKLSRSLGQKGFLVSAIHGNKTQNQRQKALELFRNGKINVLIATDVVARGIDVENISHVVNYELPETYEHYLHRIGRTGRAGKKGKAITFV